MITLVAECNYPFDEQVLSEPFSLAHETAVDRDTAIPTISHARPAKTDQTAHPRSLIRILAGHSVGSHGYKVSLRMFRLRWVFAGRSCSHVGNTVARLVIQIHINLQSPPFESSLENLRCKRSRNTANIQNRKNYNLHEISKPIFQGQIRKKYRQFVVCWISPEFG